MKRATEYELAAAVHLEKVRKGFGKIIQRRIILIERSSTGRSKFRGPSRGMAKSVKVSP